MAHKTSSRWTTIALLGCLTVLGGCEEGDTIVVGSGQDNEPPLVVTQGPEFPVGTIETPGSGPLNPWVLVGDPNGLDDISAVFFNIESIRIHDVILRPDAMSGGCASVLYEPNNVIDTTVLIPVPVDLPGVTDESMSHDDGGIYRISPFWPPSIAENFDAFGRPTGCATAGGSLEWVVQVPPSVPTPANVFLTYMEVEFIGISVTVYDKVGATATTTFSDLRVVYVTPEEKTVAP